MANDLIFKLKSIYWNLKAKFKTAKVRLFGFVNIQNRYLDKKFGMHADKIIPSRYQDQGAYRTQSTDYAKLNTLFNQVSIKDDDVLVDIGCGLGRVVQFWVQQGVSNKLFGIELDAEIAAETADHFKNTENVSILQGDACKLFPPEATLYYLYNPFNGEVLKLFLDTVYEQCINRDKLRIIYNAPLHIQEVLEDPKWKATSLKTGLMDPAYLIVPAD